MYFVIGSGPAGVSSATALLEQGLDVTMLDGGQRLEPERQAVVDGLRGVSPSQWAAESIDILKQNVSADVKGLPMKRSYGSDFPYRAGSHLPFEFDNVDILSSLAEGGLSNVWGANIMPLLAADISDWPIDIEDLSCYYTKVLSFLPYSASDDGLTSAFPLYLDTYQPLKLSSQAKALLSDMQRNADQLRQSGVLFGQSRLALQANDCVYCGNCLYGCPYRLIYNSAFSLEQLKQNRKFTYICGIVVDELEELADSLKITAHAIDTYETRIFHAERVFLGAGAVMTARIMLSSMKVFDQAVMIKDSQYFLTPLLRFRKSGAVEEESLHTLSQLCLLLRSPEISEKSAHLLIYTYSDLFLGAFSKLLGRFTRLFSWPVKAILSRLVVVQGYLHSDDSPAISVTLIRGESSRTHKVVIRGIPNAKSGTIVKKINRKLLSLRNSLGAVPLTFATHLGTPGKSYHAGGSFPMRELPEEFESDVLGRPSGFSRLHLIDSSGFTSIPATNITLTVMANAYRISTEFNRNGQ